MTLILKTNYIAKSRNGDFYVILSDSANDPKFPIRAKKIISRKAIVPTDTINIYTFSREGRYYFSTSSSDNDLVESRPIESGESFKYADTLQTMEFVSCHDLIGLFEVIDVSRTVKPDWVK